MTVQLHPDDAIARATDIFDCIRGMDRNVAIATIASKIKIIYGEGGLEGIEVCINSIKRSFDEHPLTAGEGGNVPFP